MLSSYEIVKLAYPRWQEYDQKFTYGAYTGEYYGRGQLEGLASILYLHYQELTQEEKYSLDPKYNAFIMVWGEEHDIRNKPSQNEDD